MGYTTDFQGSFGITPKLKPVHNKFLKELNNSRRMKRDVKKLLALDQGKNGLPFTFKPSDELGEKLKSLEDEYNIVIEAGANGDKRTAEEIYGHEGEYYVGDQFDRETVLDNNVPPGQPDRKEFSDFSESWDAQQKKIASGECQPGLWCQWTPSADGKELQWDGGEKFYYYTEWLKYIINRFMKPWGYKLNGEVTWQGEETGDVGKIKVVDNEVKILKATFTEE